MPLSNAQYDALLRSYDEKQQNARRISEERKAEVYALVPPIREIDRQIAEAGIAAARRAVLAGDDSAERQRNERQLEEKIRTLGLRKAAYLAQAGYPADYLEPPFSCPVCRDTGFVDGQKCSCFLQAEARLLYDEYHMGDILEKENFDTFSLEWYSDKIIDGVTGLTARQTAENALAKAKRVAERLGEPDNNLYLYGMTGLGKTFLSHCIAKAALDRSLTALYFSAPAFVELLSDTAFRRGEHPGFSDRMILSGDVLVIDDLGTELTNSFVSTQLFRCINERILRGKTTVISTNLSTEEVRDTYSDRIYSRIAAHYTIAKLIGSDIRLQKKLRGGQL